MSVDPALLNLERLTFRETAFERLMSKRIQKVLLLCSSYDAFILEEDGRIDEQIFNEYVSLNLRNPPVFIQTDNSEEAFHIMQDNHIDLVISMLSIRDIDPFSMAKQIKGVYPDIPIVVLTPFSREVSLKLKYEDLSAIDSVFCWLGNTDLLLAIIKLIEDRMNAQYDIEQVGVQAILLIEDSIRYTSSYLPLLYKLVFKQSRQFMREALNEHQQMMRMRGRPKILHATTYQEAVAIYHQYKNNLLGVISDVTLRVDASLDSKTNAGFDLCRLIRSEDPHTPILLQSSDLENQHFALGMNVGFIHKYSKNLSNELGKYIDVHFGFGDFIFRDPDTQREIARATDLKTLQQVMHHVSDKVLIYHISRNHVSKWFNARGLFSLASVFKQLSIADFEDVRSARAYIDKAIGIYLQDKGRGVISKFVKETFNEYLSFSRIGDGTIGGKARGLAFIDSVIKKEKLYNKYPGIQVTIPRTVVIGADIFEEFMEHNQLYPVALSGAADQEILDAFLSAKLPDRVKADMNALAGIVKTAIAVRSSSKLEDSHYQPFAGIYATYMLSYSNDPSVMVTDIAAAVKAIYASVFYKKSKAYIAATANIIDEEKMAIILQEICGNKYGDRFYPTFSGVARSVNFYPIAPESVDDGVANVAFGLGKYVVEGGNGIRFSPKYSKNILQLSSTEMALKETQKYFFALDVSGKNPVPTIDDSVNITRLPISAAEPDHTLRYVASTYDRENHIIRDGLLHEGKRIISFSKILQHQGFPLADILQDLLEVGRRELGTPVEIEFAANLDMPPGTPAIFNVLQIRPIITNDQNQPVSLDDVSQDEVLIWSKSALGNGEFRQIFDVVYIKPVGFKPGHNTDIAETIEKINQQMADEKRNYILCGPGRWGSSDPWLGIPVKWSQISEVSLIVESGLQHYRVDASQGTHFFQNLTSFRVGYFTINPYLNDGMLHYEYLDRFPAVYEDDFVRHVRFDKSLYILIDGKNRKGVVLKSQPE